MLWSIVSGIFFWTNLLLLLVNLISFSGFTASMEICFMTYPVIILFILYAKSPIEKKMMTPFKDLPNGYDCYDHIRHFICLSSHNNIENEVCIEGYLQKYKEQEKENPGLLKYSSILGGQAKGIVRQEKAKNTLTKKEKHQKLMEHAYNLFCKGIEKFPECTYLRLHFAVFLAEKMKNKNWALQQLNKAEKRKPPFAEQFLLYRLK